MKIGKPWPELVLLERQDVWQVATAAGAVLIPGVVGLVIYIAQCDDDVRRLPAVAASQSENEIVLKPIPDGPEKPLLSASGLPELPRRSDAINIISDKSIGAESTVKVAAQTDATITARSSETAEMRRLISQPAHLVIRNALVSSDQPRNLVPARESAAELVDQPSSTDSSETNPPPAEQPRRLPTPRPMSDIPFYSNDQQLYRTLYGWSAFNTAQQSPPP